MALRRALCLLLLAAAALPARAAEDYETELRRRAAALMASYFPADRFEPGEDNANLTAQRHPYLRVAAAAVAANGEGVSAGNWWGGRGLAFNLSWPPSETLRVVFHPERNTFHPSLTITNDDGELVGRIFALPDGRLVRVAYDHDLNNVSQVRLDPEQEGRLQYRYGGSADWEDSVPVLGQRLDPAPLYQRLVQNAEETMDGAIRVAEQLQPGPVEEDPFAEGDGGDEEPSEPGPTDPAPVLFGGMGETLIPNDPSDPDGAATLYAGEGDERRVIGWTISLGPPGRQTRVVFRFGNNGRQVNGRWYALGQAGQRVGGRPLDDWEVFTADGRRLGTYEQARGAQVRPVFRDGSYRDVLSFQTGWHGDAQSGRHAIYSDLQGGRFVAVGNGIYAPMPDLPDVALNTNEFLAAGETFTYDRRYVEGRDRWGRPVVRQLDDVVYSLDVTGRVLLTRSGNRWVASANELYHYDPASGHVFNSRGFPVGVIRDRDGVRFDEGTGFISNEVTVTAFNLSQMAYSPSFQTLGPNGARVMIRRLGGPAGGPQSSPGSVTYQAAARTHLETVRTHDGWTYQQARNYAGYEPRLSFGTGPQEIDPPQEGQERVTVAGMTLTRVAEGPWAGSYRSADGTFWLTRREEGGAARWEAQRYVHRPERLVRMGCQCRAVFDGQWVADASIQIRGPGGNAPYAPPPYEEPSAGGTRLLFVAGGRYAVGPVNPERGPEITAHGSVLSYETYEDEGEQRTRLAHYADQPPHVFAALSSLRHSDPAELRDMRRRLYMAALHQLTRVSIPPAHGGRLEDYLSELDINLARLIREADPDAYDDLPEDDLRTPRAVIARYIGLIPPDGGVAGAALNRLDHRPGNPFLGRDPQAGFYLASGLLMPAHYRPGPGGAFQNRPMGVYMRPPGEGPPLVALLSVDPAGNASVNFNRLLQPSFDDTGLNLRDVVGDRAHPVVAEEYFGANAESFAELAQASGESISDEQAYRFWLTFVHTAPNTYHRRGSDPTHANAGRFRQVFAEEVFRHLPAGLQARIRRGQTAVRGAG